MEAEASEIKKELEQIEIYRLTPSRLYYKGKIKGKDVLLVISGIGKVNAALTTSAVLSKFQVDYIINIGLAGATKPYSVSDKVVIKDASYGDFDVSGGGFGYEVGQVPGMPNPYLSDFDLVKKAVFSLGAYEESLYTQDKFATKKEAKRKGIFDMEGTAIYQVAHVFNTKVVSIKLISDIIDSDTQTSDYAHMEETSGNVLREMVLAVI